MDADAIVAPTPAGPIDPAELDVENRLARVRLRLLDSAHDLRILPTEEATERIRQVARELVMAMNDLRLVLHVRQLERTGLHEMLEGIDAKLSQGWRPKAEPVEELVDRLRQNLDSPHA